MPEPGLDRGEWLEKLMRISQSLQRQGASAQLTLVGSVTGILAGQPARTSMDLDVWKPQVEQAIQTMPSPARQTATENLVYLDVMGATPTLNQDCHP